MKTIPLETRIKIMKHVDNGGDIKELATRFDVTFQSIYSWIKLREIYGTLKPANHNKGRRSKLQPLYLESLKRILEEKPDLYLREIKDELFESTKREFNIQTIHNWIKDLGFTRKKNNF